MTWHDLAHTFLSHDAQFADQIDADQGSYCAAAFVDGELDSYLSIGAADKVVPLAPIFNSIDQTKLAAIQEQYAGSSEHYAKYADVRRWLRCRWRRQLQRYERAGHLVINRLGVRALMGPLTAPLVHQIRVQPVRLGHGSH